MATNHPEHTFSWSAIFRIVTAILGIYFVWKASAILFIIIISVMLATAIYPFVKKMATKIPFILAALISMLCLLLPFVIIAVSVLPSFIEQFPNLLKRVTDLLNSSRFLPENFRNVDLTSYAESGGKYILESTGIITTTLASILIVFFLTFYLLVDSKRLITILLAIIHKSKRAKVRELLENLAEINGQYIRGNLLVSLICGVIIFIGLSALGIPFAIPLAIFIAILDLLPLVGSSIGAIPAIIIGFSISPFTGFMVLALILIYQQVEGAIIAPTIYNKALKMSPALGFLSVLIGSSLFGIVGAFLALPMAASLPAVINFIQEDLEG